MVKNPLYRKYK